MFSIFIFFYFFLQFCLHWCLWQNQKRISHSEDEKKILLAKVTSFVLWLNWTPLLASISLAILFFIELSIHFELYAISSYIFCFVLHIYNIVIVCMKHHSEYRRIWFVTQLDFIANGVLFFLFLLLSARFSWWNSRQLAMKMSCSPNAYAKPKKTCHMHIKRRPTTKICYSNRNLNLQPSNASTTKRSD